MNITVYLGANEGNDPSLRKAVQELGTWIGASGKPCYHATNRDGHCNNKAYYGNITDHVLPFFLYAFRHCSLKK